MSAYIRRLFRTGALSERSPVWRYGFAVLTVLAALGVRLELDALSGVHAAYVPFALAVVLAGGFGGLGPALTATGLSALFAWQFFVKPEHALDLVTPGPLAGLALFVVIGALLSLFLGRLRTSLLHAGLVSRRQAQLIGLSNDAIITTDVNRIITGWNAGAAQIYGWTEIEALGKNVHDLLSTRGQTSAPEIDKALARDGQWAGELIHSTRDGREIVTESRQVLVRRNSGLPGAVLEINRDITERKRADEALCRASDQRRLALEAANLGAWDYRFETGEVFWDDRCRKMFGFPACSQVAYETAISRIHPDDRAGTDEAMKQAIAGANGGVYRGEYRVVWPDGSVHWIASYGRALFEGEGGRRRTVRFVGTNMDITERRHAEERLRQAQKLESVGLLASGVAHDFNNLLTVIMGSASTTLEEDPSSKSAKTILAASERAADLTKQLLAYAGKGQVEVRAVDLNEVVSQCSGLLLASIPKRVSVEFHLTRDLPSLEADPSRIEQIIMNLAINAAEAIPPRTDGLIQIATRSCDVTPDLARRNSRGYDVAPGRYVCLEVQDNGSGMDAATVSRIFDPFFSTKFTGRGLGLAAVQGIVRTARGFVEVSSSSGQGTTFQVFLPASGKALSAQEAQYGGSRRLGGSSTVLVVDDEEMVRKLAAATLTRSGYQVFEAENGKAALDMLAGSSQVPAVVLVDLGMPVLGGNELLPVLRSKYPDVKIVLTSGYPEADARRILTSGSISGFLQKPYTGTALVEKIGQALEQRQRAGGGRDSEAN